MLHDEPLEYIREQYDEKNEVLRQFGYQVSAVSLYEDVFLDLEIVVPVVILDEEQHKKIQPMAISDAIAFSRCRNDVLLGGCTYFNNWISKRSAKDIYAFIIDYDNAYSGVLLNALQHDWASANNEPFAKPTYIVNSGTGLHLYFVLKEPIQGYHRILENIDKLYRNLAVQQSRRVYVHKQVQWFGQDFRMAGGLNKYDWENTVFKIGDKWDIDKLAKAVDLHDLEFIRNSEKRAATVKEKRKKHKKKKKGWRSNRAFYDYSMRTCRDQTKEGNRYMSMCALTVIAWKCGVKLEELEQDLLSLLPVYNKGATRYIKEREVYSAMKMYNEKAIETQRQSLENWQGWEYKPAKRNGRKREIHLKLARNQLALLKELGEVSSGRYSKEDLVKDYIKEHPEESVTAISKALQISRTTVYKYMA